MSKTVQLIDLPDWFTKSFTVVYGLHLWRRQIGCNYPPMRQLSASINKNDYVCARTAKKIYIRQFLLVLIYCLLYKKIFYFTFFRVSFTLQIPRSNKAPPLRARWSQQDHNPTLYPPAAKDIRYNVFLGRLPYIGINSSRGVKVLLKAVSSVHQKVSV